MKIKTKTVPYSYVKSIKKPKRKKPIKPCFLLRSIVRIASIPDLIGTKFKYTGELPKKTPFLVLMNHSSFVDLKIASKILFPRPYGIVTTSDGLVGKYTLMRMIGCIPTKKFVSDISLIRDMSYLIKEKKTSVLMYPEASYSFDGTATSLPANLGKLLKILDVPVVMITTDGAFLRDPLYNCLQLRKVKVRAKVETILNAEQIRQMSVEQLDEVLNKAFTFDNFRSQKENRISVKEDFRADGLERILYKCPYCMAEGKTVGSGVTLTCTQCGKEYFLDEYGYLKAVEGKTEFDHIPDWYAWQRECVKREIESGEYQLHADVKIGMMVDYKAIYFVGDGHLTHDENGFALNGCEGQLTFTQKPLSSHGLYADYYWYELGDIICIGDNNALYYCFPKEKIPVAKARLATEEMYKIVKAKARK